MQTLSLTSIRVLTGDNDCGKSTIGRWLYYIVNGIEEYDRNALEEFKVRIMDLQEQMKLVTFEFRFSIESYYKLFHPLAIIETTLYSSTDSFEVVHKHFIQFLNEFCHHYTNFLQNTEDKFLEGGELYRP